MKRILTLVLILGLVASMTLTSCANSNAYKIATDATWKPFEFVNEKTKAIEGFDIDLFKAIAEKADIKVKFVNVSWDPLLAGMAQGTYDAAISSITITADRQKAMLFSDPYYTAGQQIAVRKSNTSINSQYDLAGKTVAVQLGTTGNIEVDKIAGAKSKPYDDIGLAFQDLMNGQVDAVVCDNPVAFYYINANSDKLKATGTVFTNEHYGIAVANGKTDLLDKINIGLKAAQDDGTIQKLAVKWKINS